MRTVGAGAGAGAGTGAGAGAGASIGSRQPASALKLRPRQKHTTYNGHSRRRTPQRQLLNTYSYTCAHSSTDLAGAAAMALALALALLAPCVHGDVVVACPDDVARCIKVGATAPLTGWASGQGSSAKRGAELWAITVNTQGGLAVGGGALLVELHMYDDASDRDQTAALFEQLISTDQVDFLLGPYGTSFSSRAAAVAAQHSRVIVLGNAAGDSSYEAQAGAPSWPHVFGVVTTTAEYTVPTAQMLRSEHGARTASVLSRNDNDFAADTAAGALTSFDRTHSAGGPILDVVASANFAGENDGNSTGTYMTSIAAGMASACAAQPDSLWLFGLKGDANALLLALAALRESCQPKSVYISSGPTELSWVTAANQLEDASGAKYLADMYQLLSAGQWTEPAVGTAGPTDALFGNVAGFRSRMEHFFPEVAVGDVIHHHAASAAAAGIVLGEGLKVATQAVGAVVDADGLPTQEALATAVRGLNMSTFYGAIRFDSSGRNIGKGTVTTQVQGGSVVPVWPTEHAHGDIVYPLNLAAIVAQAPPPSSGAAATSARMVLPLLLSWLATSI